MISVPADPPIYFDDDDYILEEDNTEEIKKVKPKSLSSLRPKDGEGAREVEWDFTKAKRQPPTRRRDDDDAQPKLFDLE